MISLSSKAVGIFFSDEFGFCTVSAAPFRRPPVNGDVIIPGHLLDMGVELIGQDSHYAV